MLIDKIDKIDKFRLYANYYSQNLFYLIPSNIIICSKENKIILFDEDDFNISDYIFIFDSDLSKLNKIKNIYIYDKN